MVESVRLVEMADLELRAEMVMVAEVAEMVDLLMGGVSLAQI